MKNNRHKSISVFISIVLTVCLIFGSINCLAYTELLGTQDVDVIYAYGGDHGDLLLQDGWSKPASGNRFAVWYTTADNYVMYCLEPGNSRTSASTAERQSSNYIRNNMRSRFLTGYQIEKFIGLIMAFGYTGKIDGGQSVRDLGYFADPIDSTGATNTTQLYEACQILIWETVVGERDANFNWVAPDEGFNMCWDIHSGDGDTQEVFENYYYTVANNVKKYLSIPSFMAANFTDAQSMSPLSPYTDGKFWFHNTSNIDLNDWTFDIVDESGNSISGCSYVISGDYVVVTLGSGVLEAYLYGWNRLTEWGPVAWSSDGSWFPGSSSQDLVQCGTIDPLSGYAKMEREDGQISIHKSSDYGVVNNVEFTLYYRGNSDSYSNSSSRGASYSLVTDTSGNASISSLPYGWYEIEETSIVNTVVSYSGYDYLTSGGNPIVHVTKDNIGSVSVSATNSVNTTVRVNKTDGVTGETVGYTTFALYTDSNSNGVIDNSETSSGIIHRDDDGDGIIVFNGIGCGDYLIAETETTSPFTLNDEIVSVHVDSPRIYDVNFTNNAWGSVSLTKVDGNNHNLRITDSSFNLYIDANSNGRYDSRTDTFYATITDENGDGVYGISNLPRQDYVIVETSTASGYEIDPQYYPFTISLSNLNPVISNCDAGVFENYPVVVGTTFMSQNNSDSPIVEYGEEITLIDTVFYDHLIVGKEYDVELTVIDRDTEEAVVDINGDPITVNITYTPETESGSFEVPVTVNSSLLSGKTIVAFERVYRDGNLVGKHEDITNPNQTLYVPLIHTTAAIDDDGNQVVLESSSVVITDTVYYENLIPGNEYRLYGMLIDKSTGDVFNDSTRDVIEEITFTPEDSTGYVEVVFDFDASGFSGDVVVYEDLYDVTTDLLIATHSDIDSVEQTITVEALPSPTPTSTPTPTPVPTVTPVVTVTPTPTSTVTPTPFPPDVTVTPTPVPPTETVTPTPVPPTEVPPEVPETGEDSMKSILRVIVGGVIVSIGTVYLVWYSNLKRKDE